jgi:hypothetical protein
MSNDVLRYGKHGCLFYYTADSVMKGLTEKWGSYKACYLVYKVKVKCTLVQVLRFCTGHTAHRRSRGVALLFHDHGTRSVWEVSVTPRPLFTPRKDPVPIVQEAGWDPGPVWTGAENLVSIEIRSPDRPARSQPLYRLSYRAHYLVCTIYIYIYRLKCRQNSNVYK